MADPKFLDRVLESFDDTGTGTLNLDGAATGFRTFVAGLGGSGDAFYFAFGAVGGADANNWEFGYGTVTDASPDTITRNLLASSSGALISWATGTKYIMSTMVASVLMGWAKPYAAAARPAWLPTRSLWVDTAGGVTALLLKFWDGTDDITLGTINETANTFVPATDPAAALLAAANVFTADQTIRSVSAGVSGPQLILDHDSASPAVGDGVGYVVYRGEDSAGNDQDYAKLFAEIVDPTSGSEDARIAHQVIIGGSLATQWYTGAGHYAASLTDPGTGIENAVGYQQSGIPLKPHVQDVIDADSAVATGTTVMPGDDTIPQITEGDEYLSVAITPKNTNNILDIEAVIYVAQSAGNHMVAGLFQDATAGALKAGLAYNAANNRVQQIKIKHRMVAGTTSATTFRVRAGPSAAATLTFNGEGGARLLGGVLASYLHIREFIP